MLMWEFHFCQVVFLQCKLQKKYAVGLWCYDFKTYTHTHTHTHTHTYIPACSGQKRKINAVQVVSPATQTENDCFHSSSFHHWFWRVSRVVILLHLSRAITHTEQIYIKQWKLYMVYHTPTHWTCEWNLQWLRKVLIICILILLLWNW